VCASNRERWLEHEALVDFTVLQTWYSTAKPIGLLATSALLWKCMGAGSEAIEGLYQLLSKIPWSKQGKRKK
jgi:hypothetical protein